jgi:dipeptidyl-peptidase-4
VALVLAAIPCLLALADPAPGSPPAKKPLPVERVFADPPLVSDAPSAIQWFPDSRGVTYIREPRHGEKAVTRLVVREVPSGKERTLCVIDTIAVPADLKEEDADTMTITSYEWAKTGPLMMFQFNGEIFTFDRKSGEVLRRTKNDKSEENTEFSPDGKKIAFTRDNDIWALDIETGAETRLTTTGSDTLMNGVLDWVYEEELFSRGDTKAYWWSPDGKKIAFLQFDESPVPAFPIVDFIPVHNTTESQRYPKAGDPNAVVRVGVVDVSGGDVAWMKVDTTDDSYIARVWWLRDGEHLALEKLTRAQDRLTLYFADARTGDLREVLSETSDTWVDVSDTKHYYETEDRFVWSSDRDGFVHLYLYGNDGTLLRSLTQGPWDVSDLDHVDEKRGLVHFTALEKSVLERHLYRVSEKEGAPVRVTMRDGTHDVAFSPDGRYFIDRFSSATEPRIITVHESSGKELFTLDKADRSDLDAYALPAMELLTFTSDEGVAFHASMIKPLDFDPAKKYPVIVYTYGFPNSHVVRNAWGRSTYLWHAAMAGRGFIVFSMDNRGAYGRGKEWAAADFKRLGLKGLDDQVAGAEYLASLSYVDSARIGIWGWSGGGTMTALAMLRAPGVFKAGAAVAPVTDWRLYDSIYTERYMRLPKDNEDGYRDASPANFANGLQGALLLVHGTADDNVHVQNTMVLVKKLIKAGKQFDLMVYPGGGHGIGGNTERKHLFTKLTQFFEENL